MVFDKTRKEEREKLDQIQEAVRIAQRFLEKNNRIASVYIETAIKKLIEIEAQLKGS